MALYLSLLIFSFIITSILIVPFINLLYKFRVLRRKQVTKDFQGKQTKIFDKFHGHKVGTPMGGGLLVILVVAFLYAILFPLISYLGVFISSAHSINEELNILFFSFISFGILGLYDDLRKLFGFKQTGFFGLRMRHKLVIQLLLALVIGMLLYWNLGIDFFHIPFLGTFRIGWWYVPLSALIIVSFTNAFNITDGLDGLSSGLLTICLFAFWLLANSVLDTPLSIFLALWIGSLIAFLYFNVYPARIWLGDVGALAFGATLAVVGLLIGKVMALVVMGGIFVVEVGSSLLQIFWKKFFHKKLFAVAPLHLWLQNKGWEEPKIVMRAWLAGLILAIFGMWMAVI
ncbi:phospho-N-acetylmuramoyl-pentapeptide-transferase [Patescibacteria group bacterium]